MVLALGIFSVSWAAIFVRFCDAPAVIIAFYRLGISTLILAAGYRWFGGGSLLKLEVRSYLWILLSGLFLGIHFIAWIEAVQRIPVFTASTLATTHPIVVGLVSWLFLGERMHRYLGAGIALSFLGAVFMGWSGGGPESAGLGEDRLGYALAVGASLGFSAYVLIGRKVRRTVGLLDYILPTYGAAALFVLVIVLLRGVEFTGYDAQTYAMFLLLASVPTVVGHSSFNWALRYVSATLVTVSVLGEPVGAAVLAVLFLGETPSPLKLLSGLVILIGIYLAARGK